MNRSDHDRMQERLDRLARVFLDENAWQAALARALAPAVNAWAAKQKPIVKTYCPGCGELSENSAICAECLEVGK